MTRWQIRDGGLWLLAFAGYIIVGTSLYRTWVASKYIPMVVNAQESAFYCFDQLKVARAQQQAMNERWSPRSVYHGTTYYSSHGSLVHAVVRPTEAEAKYLKYDAIIPWTLVSDDIYWMGFGYLTAEWEKSDDVYNPAPFLLRRPSKYDVEEKHECLNDSSLGWCLVSDRNKQ